VGIADKVFKVRSQSCGGGGGGAGGSNTGLIPRTLAPFNVFICSTAGFVCMGS